MEVKYSLVGDRIYFYMSGELDEHYAKGAKDYMEAVLSKNQRVKKVIFNMQELSFMDSTGVGMLLGRYKRLKKSGVECFIENPQYSVEKVLQISGIYEIMPRV